MASLGRPLELPGERLAVCSAFATLGESKARGSGGISADGEANTWYWETYLRNVERALGP